ncbi:MAG TPA: hypothetical protein VHV78_04375, partial [Gemmatimonadaceae bacterium]|nr:hypothetical protein [Gemmatimonadaceae bacterium]
MLAARIVHAQFVIRSWVPWRTVATDHFEFHYPADLDEWTRDIASRAESIDSAVSRIVGFAPRDKVHVVVDNPFDEANGSAWPFLDQPVINLWATPPTPRDDIGEFHEWGEMLLSHEFAHIAHLTRPSRNLLTRQLWELAPVDLGPISLDAPRWLIEGYATYVEGKVTGSGRPHGAWRAAFLRQWALEGRLPQYDQLDAPGGFEGGEFAYLAGSAFLEWLVQRPSAGDSSLTALWRRMTARQTRSFDEAFTGVYGESPRALYGRFTAELTGRALEVERSMRDANMPSPSDTGTIIQRLSLGTGDPAMAPDGKRVALVVRSAALPSRVVIWSTAPEPDTGRTRRDSTLRARDPEDVPARPIYPPPKKVLASLCAAGGAPYESPRFLSDGRIIVTKNTSVGDGTLRSDAYLWNPTDQSVQRLTHSASIFDPDPLPDGRSAIATQCRHGWCDVVALSLADGAVRTLLAGSPTRSYYRPRVSPDGSRFVVSVNDGRGWTLASAAISENAAIRVLSVLGTNSYDAGWMDDSTLVFTTDRSG